MSFDDLSSVEKVRAWAKEWFDSDGSRLRRFVVEGRLLFEAEILVGKDEPPIPIYLEPLSLMDRVRARAEARKLAQALKLDPEQSPDLWTALDGFSVLALSIRDRTPPYGQHRGLENLLDTYGKRPGCLERVADLLRIAEQLADPRVPTLTEEMAWELVRAVRERGHLGPLAGIAGYEQAGLLIFMADRLWNYRTESSSKSSESSSTPED